MSALKKKTLTSLKTSSISIGVYCPCHSRIILYTLVHQWRDILGYF